MVNEGVGAPIGSRASTTTRVSRGVTISDYAGIDTVAARALLSQSMAHKAGIKDFKSLRRPTRASGPTPKG